MNGEATVILLAALGVLLNAFDNLTQYLPTTNIIKNAIRLSVAIMQCVSSVESLLRVYVMERYLTWSLIAYDEAIQCCILKQHII